MAEPTDAAGATPAAGGATPPQTPPAPPAAAAPPTPPATPPPATGDDGLGDAGKRALDAIRAEKKLAEDRAKAAETELEKFRNASKSDAEKAIDEAKKAGAAEVTERLHARVRRAEVKVALTAAGATPSLIEDLANAAEFGALKVDDQDQVVGLDEAIKAHKARVPDAYRASAQPWTADGGVRGSGKTVTREQIKRMTPEEINAAFDRGELAGLLKPG